MPNILGSGSTVAFSVMINVTRYNTQVHVSFLHICDGTAGQFKTFIFDSSSYAKNYRATNTNTQSHANACTEDYCKGY